MPGAMLTFNQFLSCGAVSQFLFPSGRCAYQ